MPDGGSEVDEVKDDLDSIVVGDVEVRVEADLVGHLIPACEELELEIKDGSRGSGSWSNLGNVKNLTCSIDGPLILPKTTTTSGCALSACDEPGPASRQDSGAKPASSSRRRGIDLHEDSAWFSPQALDRFDSKSSDEDEHENTWRSQYRLVNDLRALRDQQTVVDDEKKNHMLRNVLNMRSYMNLVLPKEVPSSYVLSSLLGMRSISPTRRGASATRQRSPNGRRPNGRRGSSKSETPSGAISKQSVDNLDWTATFSSSTPSHNFMDQMSDEGEEDDRHRSHRANVTFVLALLVLGLATVIDLVSLFLWQVFWSTSNFLCVSSVSPAQALAQDTYRIFNFNGVRVEAFVIPCTVLSIYSFFILVAIKDRYGHTSFLKSQTVLGKACHLLWIPFLSICLISSWAILIMHKNLCGQGGVTVSVDWGTLIVTGRLHFLLHVVRTICALFKLLDLSGELKLRIQTAVSRNKRRFLDPGRGFDLDLTYVCDRLVAMSMPCTKGAVHRNDIREVSRFFATRHYSRFLVFNLCEQHEEHGNGLYHPDFFFGQVRRIPHCDHNVPSLLKLLGFILDAIRWLNNGPDYLVAVHCQGGKGRTGLFCASLTIATSFVASDGEAISYFGLRRKDEKRPGNWLQTVTAPCQKRYLGYIDDIFGGFEMDWNRSMLLTRITMQTMPEYLTHEEVYVLFVIQNAEGIQYDSSQNHGLIRLQTLSNSGHISPAKHASETYDMEVGQVLLKGDITIRFYIFDSDADGQGSSRRMSSKQSYENVFQSKIGDGATTVKYGDKVGRQFAFISFHTACVQNPDLPLVFSKSEIDDAYKAKHAHIHDQFSLSLIFLDKRNIKRQDYDNVCTGRNKMTANELETDDILGGRSWSPMSVRNATPLNSALASPLPISHQHPDATSTSRQSYALPDTSGRTTNNHSIVWWRRYPPFISIRQERIVEKMFDRLCRVTTTYLYGEVMCLPTEATARKSLRRIVSGVAQWENPAWSDAYASASMSQFTTLGAGDIIDWSSFLGRNTEKPESEDGLLIARSSQVVVQTIVFESIDQVASKRRVLSPSPKPFLTSTQSSNGQGNPLPPRYRKSTDIRPTTSDGHQCPNVSSASSRRSTPASNPPQTATRETFRRSPDPSPDLACASHDRSAKMEPLLLDSSPRESLSQFSSGQMCDSSNSSPCARDTLSPLTEEVSWTMALQIQAGSNFNNVPPAPCSASLPQQMEEIDAPAGAWKSSTTQEEWVQTIASLAPSVQYQGITTDELSALYEHLAITLQTKEIGMDNELQMLGQRPRLGQSENTMGADGGFDARISCWILQACGLPANEKLLHIFKDTNGLNIHNSAGSGVDSRTSSLNSSQSPAKESRPPSPKKMPSFKYSFKQTASNLFKKSGSVFSRSGAPQPGALCIYQNVAVFCSNSLKNYQEVEEIFRGGNDQKKLCTIIRLKQVAQVSCHDMIVSLYYKPDKDDDQKSRESSFLNRDEFTKGRFIPALASSLRQLSFQNSIRRISSGEVFSDSGRSQCGTSSPQHMPGTRAFQVVLRNEKEATQCTALLKKAIRLINKNQQEIRNAESLPDEYQGFGYFLATDKDEEVQAFVQALRTEGTVMAFPRGEVIVPMGERLRGVYHIIKGTALIKSESGDVLAVMEEGSVFGKSTMISTNCRGSVKKVMAYSDCTVVRLTDADLQLLNQRFPLACVRFWRRMSVVLAVQVQRSWSRICKLAIASPLQQPHANRTAYRSGKTSAQLNRSSSSLARLFSRNRGNEAATLTRTASGNKKAKEQKPAKVEMKCSSSAPQLFTRMNSSPTLSPTGLARGQHSSTTAMLASRRLRMDHERNLKGMTFDDPPDMAI